MKKFAYLDFEFRDTQEKDMTIVCAHVLDGVTGKGTDLWYYDLISPLQSNDSIFTRMWKEDYIFVCWNAVAEARALMSIGYTNECLNGRWIDLHAEYKMLLNHNHELMYGEHLFNGKVIVTTPPQNKWNMTEEEIIEANNSRPSTSLASGVYKLLGKIIDTEHKEKIREIIISGEGIEKNKNAILKYCAEDVKYLPELLKAVLSIHKNHGIVKLGEMFYRAKTMVNTAVMEKTGYPVNVKWVENFSKNVPVLMKELAQDINSQFPDAPPFKENKRSAVGYSKDMNLWREWIETNEDVKGWMRTGKGKPSLSLDAWSRKYRTSHSFERNNFPEQIIRYLKFEQGLNGFKPKSPLSKDKKTFLDYIGSDGRVRCYLNPYGAQTGRYQPGSTGFLPLKSAWMRSMIYPKWAICGIDYGSQEFLISALLSKDSNMIAAYSSGDVYLYTAKLAGAVPWDGTKEEYKKERNIFKTLTLGISYLMGARGLASNLSQVLGRPVDEDEAQNFIDAFFDVYSNYAEFINETKHQYDLDKHIKLPDGWVMYGDNDNFRSVCNMPIQGMGSCIARKMVDLAVEGGLKIIFPLHDAGYFELSGPPMREEINSIIRVMKDAFAFYFKEKELARDLIRLDGVLWGPAFQKVVGKNKPIEVEGVNFKVQDIYIDERGEREYKQFKKFMFYDLSESEEDRSTGAEEFQNL